LGWVQTRVETSLTVFMLIANNALRREATWRSWIKFTPKQKGLRERMGKRQIPDPPNFKKYGVPFYSVAWIPQHVIKLRQIETADNSSDSDHDSAPSTEPDSEPATKADSDSSSIAGNYLLFTGGGGAGRSGIPNALVIAHFDSETNSLSSEPVRIFLLLLTRLRNSCEFVFFFDENFETRVGSGLDWIFFVWCIVDYCFVFWLECEESVLVAWFWYSELFCRSRFVRIGSEGFINFLLFV